jgi:predicted Zn-dependent protease
MNSEFIDRIRDEISRDKGASNDLLRQIDDELRLHPSAELWILRGDAIQLSDGEAYQLDAAETSYQHAIQRDPSCAAAYESLAHFTYAVKDDARASLEFFRKAISLGAGSSALEGLRDAENEIREFGL